MAIFLKCPVCGETSIVEPELADRENRVFRCENGHQFRIAVEEPEKVVSQNVWDHMPEWSRMLNERSKNKKIGG